MKRFGKVLERAFRHGFVYPILRTLLRNEVSDEPLELGTIKRILIVRYDRIGDMIVTTPVFKALKRRNPQVRIDVIASSLNDEIARSSPFVDEVIVLERNWLRLVSQIRRLRRQEYDVVLNLVFNRTTLPSILANVAAPKGFKVGQGHAKFAFYVNRMLELPRFEQHMAERLVAFIEAAFGIEVSDEERGLELEVSQDARERVDQFLNAHGLRRRSPKNDEREPYVLVNVSVKAPARKLSPEQAAAIANTLSAKQGLRVVLLIAPGDDTMERAATMLPERGGTPVFRTTGAQPLTQLASLVEGALGVVTMDTSLVHFASAMRTPVLAFYTGLPLLKEWSPYRVPYETLLAPAGQTISCIPIEGLTRKIDEFIGSTLPRAAGVS